MESSLAFMDDLLDFSSDIGEEDEEEERPRKLLLLQEPKAAGDGFQPSEDHSSSRILTEEDYAEEELEWLSNKDAFPAVETFVDILSEQPPNDSKQHSPVSVLDNTSSSSNSDTSNKTSSIHDIGHGSILMSCCGSLKVPGKARSKRRRKHISAHPAVWFTKHPTTNKSAKQIPPMAMPMTTVAVTDTSSIGRKCLHCGAEKTPQWRAGPLGPKTLCNACGVRYKSGRLVPEYRPASSPTFSPHLHSNSHRKVVEMRRQKHLGMLVNPMDKG